MSYAGCETGNLFFSKSQQMADSSWLSISSDSLSDPCKSKSNNPLESNEAVNPFPDKVEQGHSLFL